MPNRTSLSSTFSDDMITALTDRGITVLEAEMHGVLPIHTVDDLLALSMECPIWWEKHLPAMAFPYEGLDGERIYQLRLQNRIKNSKGKELRYLWPDGHGSILNALRPVDGAVTTLIVEGTGQSMKASIEAPTDTAVYGIAGCWNWRADQMGLPDLAVVEGTHVVLAFDADITTNPNVRAAATALAEECELEGALSVKFIPPARGTAKGEHVGLDDVLAKKGDRAKTYLANLIKKAGAMPKAVKPSELAKADAEEALERLQADPDRPMVIVNDDPWIVINAISDHMVAFWSGTRLFNHGKVISQFDGVEMTPIPKAAFGEIAVESCTTVKRQTKGDNEFFTPAWPDPNVLGACFVRFAHYCPLDKITHAPFMRNDGTVCQEPGYDEASRTILVMNEAMSDFHVPEEPTQEDLQSAVKYLRYWLTDLLDKMPDDGSRANFFALLLTPFIRGMFDLAPMAVINGIDSGVGKGISIELLALLWRGRTSTPLPFKEYDDENAKLILAEFLKGNDIMIFDEAHVIHGNTFARAITAPNYSDRILGGSVTASFRNQVTWAALGNNVVIKGDMSRRTYQIVIDPPTDGWRDQAQHTFTIPDIRYWTVQNRGRLMSAVLTIIRAWFTAGQPSGTVSFANFEGWEKCIGGILTNAGITGFLDGREQWRDSNNFDRVLWREHFEWVMDQMGDGVPFVMAALVAKMIGFKGGDVPTPPDLDDPLAKGYSKELAKRYLKQRRVMHGRVRMEKCEVGAQGGVARWKVSTVPDAKQGVSSDVAPDIDPSPTNSDISTEGGTSTSDTQSLTRHGGLGGSGGFNPPTRIEKEFFTPPVSQKRVIRGGAENEGTVPSEASVAGQTLFTITGVAKTGAMSENSAVMDDVTSTDVISYEAIDHTTWSQPATRGLSAGRVSFDIESADKILWPLREDFIRITGMQTGKTIRIDPDATAVAATLAAAKRVIGHNIVSFDLVAFALHHDLDIEEMADQGQLHDTMLTEILNDPPEARTPVGKILKHYSLDAVGKRKLGAGKTDDLEALAKEYGGYDKIPVDEARYNAYCAGDVNVATQIAATQVRTPYVVREHKVAAIAARMRMNGFRVDVALLQERVAEGRERRRELTQQLADNYSLPLLNAQGEPQKAPMATDRGKEAMRQAFLDLGVELAQTAGGKPALGKEAMQVFTGNDELPPHENPDVVALAEIVMALNGIRSVYETVDRCRIGDRVHPNITMLQASGRWSITDPGITVMGKKNGKHVEREVLLAEEGEVMMCFDLSQADARAVAVHSQDENYLGIFSHPDAAGKPRDLHTEVAVAVFGEEARGNKETREFCKPITHGWNYNMGLTKLARVAGSMEVARQYEQAMHQQYPDLIAWKERMVAMGDAGMDLDNGFGRILRCTPGHAFTQAPALIGQATTADWVKEGLLRLRAMDPAYTRWLRLYVHDEIGFSVPIDRVQEALEVIPAAMSFSWAPEPGFTPVQVIAEAPTVWAPSWGGCYAK